jgi:hypothetical protein
VQRLFCTGVVTSAAAIAAADLIDMHYFGGMTAEEMAGQG